MDAWKILLLSLGATLGAGLCAEEARSSNATGEKPSRIVVLGDSITAGYGLDPAEAYPALLQKKIAAAGLPYTVSNAGVSGDTTAGGLRRVEWALKPGAEVLIVALGGNDGLRGLRPQQTADNLVGIIKKAREKSPGIEVVVAGMEMPQNMGEQYLSAFRALFPKVAEENKAALVPFLLEGVGGVAELNQADLIHPTAGGQERVAENVWKVLQVVLTKRGARVP